VHQLQQSLLEAAGGSDQFEADDGILRFVREKLKAEPAPYQARVLRDLLTYKRVVVKAPRGAGKTTIAAWCAIWALYAFLDDTKVILTASVWRQLTKMLMPEVRKWLMRTDLSPTPMILGTEVRIPPHKELFCVASGNPWNLEGVHANNVMIILDEAKNIDDPFFDAWEGTLSTPGNHYTLMISTPGRMSGRFYNICRRAPGFEDWRSIHITLQECIEAGRITQEWADQRKRQWGEDSQPYRNYALAEFHDSGEDKVIPLHWVEKANDRWRECEGKYIPPELEEGEEPEPPRTAYGVDPAYKGADKTAICKMVGRVVYWIKSYDKQEIMETAGRVAALVDKDTPIAVDAIGVGAGVYSRLAELEYAVMGVNVSRRSKMRGRNREEFMNLRSAIWWMMREALDPDSDDPIALPPDDKLSGDLCAPSWEYRSDGKIQVEGKDGLRESLGRSPDKADALGLTLYAARAARKVVFV